MKRHAVGTFCAGLLLAMARVSAGEGDFGPAVTALLRHRVEEDWASAGLVVGLVDERGLRIICYGRDKGHPNQELSGDTVFEIGSITKVFTGLLLQDMVDRGQMKLDDPVAKFLPPGTKIPVREGKQITLVELATHTSGLPLDGDNFAPRDWLNPYADYTAEQMYAFLAGFSLPREPGTKFEYSNLGMGLLGHAIALKSGSNFEGLVLERICRPLKMESTRITLTPEMRQRMAQGHNMRGEEVGNLDLKVTAGSGGLRSSANDMLKFLAANLGLPRNDLTAAMERSHVVQYREEGMNQALGWGSVTIEGEEILQKNGGTFGFSSYIGLEKNKHRGVVVLSNSRDDHGVSEIGTLLLFSDWHPADRLAAVNIDPVKSTDLEGQYQLGPEGAGGLVISIRRDGEHMLLKPVGDYVTSKLSFESENSLVGDLTGRRVSFTRDGGGKVVQMSLNVNGALATARKISDEPYRAAERAKPRVAVKVDAGVLDKVVGRYRLPSGTVVSIVREQNQLVARMKGSSVPMALLAESEDAYFYPNGTAEFLFIRNDRGEVDKLVANSLETSGKVEGVRIAGDSK